MTGSVDAVRLTTQVRHVIWTPQKPDVRQAALSLWSADNQNDLYVELENFQKQLYVSDIAIEVSRKAYNVLRTAPAQRKEDYSDGAWLSYLKNTLGESLERDFSAVRSHSNVREEWKTRIEAQWVPSRKRPAPAVLPDLVEERRRELRSRIALEAMWETLVEALANYKAIRLFRRVS